MDKVSQNLSNNDKNNTEPSSKRRPKSLACILCRKRHIKCSGGNPCARCIKHDLKCEYIEPSKKIVVSMKYLQQLQDSLANMKRENVRLQSLVSRSKTGSPLQGKDDNATLKDENTNEGASRRLPLTGLLQESSQMTEFNNNTVEDRQKTGTAITKKLNTNENGSTSSNMKKNEENVDNEEDETIESTFAQRSGRLVETPNGQLYFVGSSSMTLFGLEIQSMVSKYLSEKKFKPLPVNDGRAHITHTIMKDFSNNQNLSFLSSISEPIEKIEKLKDGTHDIILVLNDAAVSNHDHTIKCKLPSYSYSLLLIDTFLSYNDECFYFFNEGIIKHNLKTFYETDRRSYDDNITEAILCCELLLILALGEMYLGTVNNLNGSKNNEKTNDRFLDGSKLPGSGLFKEASKIFNCLFSSEHLECVTKEGGIEVLLLYAFYLQVADCTVASYFYFGQALRACLILGMHVDAQRDTLTRFELEHHRRLWWTVYMFERMLSSKAGLPLSFTDNTISTELPDDFEMSSPPKGCEYFIFPQAEFLSNCVKIVQINAHILNQLYQRQPESNILPILQRIIAQLLQWRNDLSECCQVDFNVPDLKISRLCANLFTEYFQGINLAIRPLLFHFLSLQLKRFKDDDDYNTYLNLQNYSKSISTLLNCSLQASVNTVRSLWYLLGENKLALFGYMDREYLFTSSCTLLLFNATFGIHEQTSEYLDYTLEIFTKMEKLGNNPAGLRKTQLLTMMLNLDFHGIMKDLISKHTVDDDQQTFREELLPEAVKNTMKYFINPTPAPGDNDNYEIKDDSGTPLRKNSISTTSFSNFLNIPTYQTEPLTAKGNEVIENNGNQLDPTNYVDNEGLQELLDNLDRISSSDNKLWEEISGQAMWLGTAMDPTGAAGTELDVNDFLANLP